MDRYLRSREGFTLLELVVGLGLGAVVLLTASDFVINFAKYSSNFIKSEASLVDTGLVTFEEMVDKIYLANKAVCGAEAAMDVPSTARPAGCATDGTCIQVRCDTSTPLIFSDDTVYTYWKNGTDLYKAVNSGAGAVIATGINTLSFTRVNKDNTADNTYLNTIRVQLGVQASSGVTGGVLKESLDTTVVLRGKSLN